jgi:hypothetical protein
MIYYNSDIARSMQWSIADIEAGETARAFLQGESQLLRLARSDSGEAFALAAFLEACENVPLTVQRAHSGDLLVRAGTRGDTLLITGRTANVLSSYLDDAPVRMQDRFDMTVRRRVNVS